MTPEMQALAGRVERLEKQNHRLKQVGIVLLLAASVALLVGQALGKRIVTANEFILKDANGKTRAFLGMELGDPTFELYDADGPKRPLGLVGFEIDKEPRISLAASGHSMLSLDDGDRGSLFLSPIGGFSVENHGRVASLSWEAEGPQLKLHDVAGFESVLGVTHNETIRTGESHVTSAASLTLYGKDGKVIWKAP